MYSFHFLSSRKDILYFDTSDSVIFSDECDVKHLREARVMNVENQKITLAHTEKK